MSLKTLLFFLYNFFFLVALGLCCCMWAFSSCDERGLLLAVMPLLCRAQALACGLSSRGTWTWLLRGMWNLPGPGVEPVSPALAGGHLSTGQPGESISLPFNLQKSSSFSLNCPDTNCN